MTITAQTLSQLRKVASRYSRVSHEAEDLVQDVLIAAIERGRDCGEPGFLPWALGYRSPAITISRPAASVMLTSVR